MGQSLHPQPESQQGREGHGAYRVAQMGRWDGRPGQKEWKEKKANNSG